MKKCTIILMVIFTIVACKKGEADSPTIETNVDKPVATIDSLTLDDYYKLPNIEEKAKWLRLHGDRVKRKILEVAVLEIHEVKGAISNQKEKYVISWGSLKKIIKDHGYNAYLGVNFKEKKINSLEMVDKYGDRYYCFSTTLIRSLAKKYTKNDNTEFEFSFATITEKPKKSIQTAVVIQVNGTPYYYDYSTEPPFISNDNKPL